MNTIKQVKSESEIKTVSDLAREIYTEHYTPITGVEQVEYMLDKFQSEKAIGEQIKEGLIYCTINFNNKPCGYFAVEPNNPNGKLFLSKLYLRKSTRGQGLGKKAFNAIKKIAEEKGLISIWLHVNKMNPSIGVYESLGFEISESVKDPIGGGFYMDDYLMELRLNK